MIDAFFELPLFLRSIIGLSGFLVLCAPIGIWLALDRIRAQNERIISLLVDIREGRRIS